MEFQQAETSLTLSPSGFTFFSVYAAAVLYGVHVALNANFTYALDPSFPDLVALVFAINISLLVFIQLSLAYHQVVSPQSYRTPVAMKGLRFAVSYIFIALAFLAYLQYLPGEPDTNQGTLLKNGVYRLILLSYTCFVWVSYGGDQLRGSGVALALVLTFVGSQYDSHVLYIVFFIVASVYHQLFDRDTKYDVYLFACLMPLGASLPFILVWTDLSQNGLCRFMVPLHIWLTSITFPAVYLWFDVANMLPRSFSEIFSDSCLLSMAHNKFGPTAIPLKFFVPFQFVAFCCVTFLGSSTCGTLQQFNDDDLIFLTRYCAAALLLLFLTRAIQDQLDSKSEDLF